MSDHTNHPSWPSREDAEPDAPECPECGEPADVLNMCHKCKTATCRQCGHWITKDAGTVKVHDAWECGNCDRCGRLNTRCECDEIDHDAIDDTKDGK